MWYEYLKDPHYITLWNTVLSPRNPVSNVGGGSAFDLVIVFQRNQPMLLGMSSKVSVPTAHCAATALGVKG